MSNFETAPEAMAYIAKKLNRFVVLTFFPPLGASAERWQTELERQDQDFRDVRPGTGTTALGACVNLLDGLTRFQKERQEKFDKEKL